MYWPVYRRSLNWKTYIKEQYEIAKAIHDTFRLKPKNTKKFFLNVCCVFVFYVFLCCSVCWFLYGPFCHGALKLKIFWLFTTFFVNISSIYIVMYLLIWKKRSPLTVTITRWACVCNMCKILHSFFTAWKLMHLHSRQNTVKFTFEVSDGVILFFSSFHQSVVSYIVQQSSNELQLQK